jgi:hypothetical protein
LLNIGNFFKNNSDGEGSYYKKNNLKSYDYENNTNNEDFTAVNKNNNNNNNSNTNLINNINSNKNDFNAIHGTWQSNYRKIKDSNKKFEPCVDDLPDDSKIVNFFFYYYYYFFFQDYNFFKLVFQN